MTVNGGDGNDTIDVDGSANLTGGTMTINGNGGDDVIDVDGGTNDAGFTTRPAPVTTPSIWRSCN